MQEVHSNRRVPGAETVQVEVMSLWDSAETSRLNPSLAWGGGKSWFRRELGRREFG